MNKRIIIFLTLIGLALFLNFKKTKDRAASVSKEEILIDVKKTKPHKLEPAVPQKDMAPHGELPSESIRTASTTPSGDRVKPQSQVNVIRFEGSDENDPGYIELTPSCDGCKPSTTMTLVNAVTGVRVRTPQPNSSTIKDLVPGARRTFGFHGSCGFTFQVILIFNYDTDTVGKAQFLKSIYRIKTRGIQKEEFNLSSQDFITDLKKIFSLEDCKTIQTSL